MSVVYSPELLQFLTDVRPQLVRALTVHCGSRAIAEELAQETLVRCVEHWNTVSGAQSPEAWAMRVGFNLSKSRWRRVLLERRHDDATPAAPKPDPAGDLTDLVVLREALDLLPRRQREAVVCRHLLGFDVAATAPPSSPQTRPPRTPRPYWRSPMTQRDDSFDALLGDLAGPEPDALDISDLDRRLRRRHRTRQSGIGMILAVVGLTGAGLLATTSPDRPGDIETVGDAQTAEPAADPEADAEAGPEAGPEVEEAIEAMGSYLDNDVIQEGMARQAAYDYLAALESGEYEFAAERAYRAAPLDGSPPGQPAAEVAELLAERCEAGCNGPWTVELQHDQMSYPPGGLIELVVTPSDGRGEPSVLRYRLGGPVTAAGSGAVSGFPPAGGEAERPTLPERLFGEMVDSRLVVARTSGYEIWSGGTPQWVLHPSTNPAFTMTNRYGHPSAEVDGDWAWGSGQFTRLDDPDIACDYSELSVPGTPPMPDGTLGAMPVASPVERDGNLVAQVVVLPFVPGGDDGSPWEPVDVLVDCATGTVTDGPLITEHDAIGAPAPAEAGKTGAFLVIRPDGTWAGGGQVLGLDGEAISGSDEVGAYAFGPDGTTVAYTDYSGDGAPQIVLRSTESGEELGRWDAGITVSDVLFDGRWVLATIRDADGLVDGYLVLDTETGETREVDEPARIVSFG